MFFEVLSAFGVGTLVLGGVAWLLKAVISKHLDVQGGVQLERIRSESRIIENRQSTAFTWLHKKRCDVIEGCYSRLALVYRQACVATNVQDHVASKGRVDALQELAKRIGTFDEYLCVNRLYLPKEVADQAREFADKVYVAGWNYKLMIDDADFDKKAPYEGIQAARKTIHEEAKGILDNLEQSFRRLIEGKDHRDGSG